MRIQRLELYVWITLVQFLRLNGLYALPGCSVFHLNVIQGGFIQCHASEKGHRILVDGNP
jgi:hypothetical protein